MAFSWPGFDSLRQLSAEQATELAARVAEFSRAGLPLGPGLRSFAGELASRPVRRVLLHLADRLDAGDDLAAAMQSQGRRLPLCLHGLVLAGLRSGRLAEALDQYVDLQHQQLDLRRRVWKSVAYPLFLVIFMAAIVVAARLFIIDHFDRLFRDFNIDLPELTLFVIQSSWPAVWAMAGLVAVAAAVPVLLAVAPAAGWLWPLVYRVPMLGSLLRWSHVAQFSRLMGLLLDQNIPLPDAFRLCAAGLRDTDLADGCQIVAADVENGTLLYESMAAERQFPPSMIPIVQWGQDSAALPDAFRGAAEMFEGRVRSQGSLLETILLPILLLTIVTFIGFFVTAMMLPLIRLITCLSGH